MTFKQQLDRWLLTLTRSVVQGNAITMRAFFASAGANALLPDVPALNVKQIACIWLLSIAYQFFNFLADNPIPAPAPESKVELITPK